MVALPSSPWQVGGPGQGQQIQTPYDGTSLRLDSDLYYAGAKIGFSPLEIDEMELWQIAAAFGSDYERPEHDGEQNSGSGVRSNRDVLAERMAHFKGEGPKPEAEKPGGDVLNLMKVIEQG